MDLPALAIQPFDLVGAQQKLASLGQTQAQNQALDIANQQSQLGLDLTKFKYGSIGIPMSGGATPNTNQLATLNAPQGQGSPPPGGMLGAPAPPGAAPQQTQDGSFPGQLGMRLAGVAMPPLMAASLIDSKNPNAIKDAIETRRQNLYQLANVPPQLWNASVDKAYATGWIDPQQHAQLSGHPEFQERLLQSLSNPDEHSKLIGSLAGQGMGLGPLGETVANPGAIAASAAKTSADRWAGVAPAVAQAGGEAGARAPYEAPVEMTVPDGKGGFRTEYVTRPALAGMAGGAAAKPTTGADLANPAVTVSGDAFAGRVSQRESGGDPNAKNPLSSATGGAQFIDGTWLPLVKSARPDLAQGKTDEQILAMRNDPALSRQMTTAYAQQNAPILQNAGVQPNSLTLGLAHQLGPAGAVSVMTAPANAKVSTVLSDDVLKANPDLRNKTVGDLMAGAFKTYGVNSVDFNAAPPAAAGVVPGKPVLSPQQAAGLDVTKTQIGKDATDMDKTMDAVQHAQTAQTQLTQIRDLTPNINTGSFADARQRVQNYLATFSPEAAQKFTAAMSGGLIDPTKAGATQEFVKLTLQQAGSAEKDTLGSRGGLGAITLYQKAFPNIEMQPSAIKDMSNLLLVAHQRSVDYGIGANDHLNAQRDSFTSGGPYAPVSKYDADFVKSHSPQLYVGAAAALNDKPYAEWSKGLDAGQQAEALRILWRADPNAVITGKDGKTQYHNPALAQAAR